MAENGRCYIVCRKQTFERRLVLGIKGLDGGGGDFRIGIDGEVNQQFEHIGLRERQYPSGSRQTSISGGFAFSHGSDC